jgi:cytoskeletal protein RodZ
MTGNPTEENIGGDPVPVGVGRCSMETFGEKLRFARESRGLSIEAVARILQVDEDRLLALEHNDFEKLPDNDAMTACLQAYAESLEVEADLMLADYLREREVCLRKLEDALPSRTPPIPREAISFDRDRDRRSLVGILVLALLATVAMLVTWWMLAVGGETSPTIVPDAVPLAESAPAAPSPTAGPGRPARTPTGTSTELPPTTSESSPDRSAQPASAPTGMRIPDHGVGTRVSNRQLFGRASRFREGTRVWFWNNVLGGDPGDRIDHVWLRDGEEVIRIPLKIGGPRWRTYSAKVLAAPGTWAVEARAEDGRVLARDELHGFPRRRYRSSASG